MKDKPELQIPQTGKDEMNLAEYPITLLSKRHSPEIKTIEFTDEIMGEGGKRIRREWVVSGSDRYGLPLAIDNDVLMALMAIGKEQNFDTPKIHFSRYRLCKMMKWSDAGSNYKRIEEAFDRLKGSSIKAKNAFWDNDRKGYVTKNFGIIDEYELFDSARRQNVEQDSFPFSYVILSHTFYQSIKSGYIKALDTKIYFKLKNAIAKRLYRYLDKKRYDGKRKFEINLFTLAEVHIGLQKTKYASHIREKLDPAHEELVQIGFLKGAEYQRTADQKSEKVIYTFGRKVELPAPGQAEPAEPERQEKVRAGELLEKLVQTGIAQKAAEQILREYPDDVVRMQIEALPYRNIEDPPAALISSIQNNWALPPKYEEHLKKDKLKKIDMERHEQEQQQKAERRGKIQTFISTLSRDELADLTNEAREKAREEGGALFRDREVPSYMVNAYVHMIVEKRLGL